MRGTLCEVTASSSKNFNKGFVSPFTWYDRKTCENHVWIPGAILRFDPHT
jgi:hypothetical protein